MALPPTKFKALIAFDANRTFDDLNHARCLSRQGERDRPGFVAFFIEVSKQAHAELDAADENTCGPNWEDLMEQGLLASLWVNGRAHRLANEY